MIEPVVPILTQARSVYIATHVSPDGDAIGSSLGLAWALGAIGKQCTVACADPVPSSLRFLPGSETIVNQPPSDQDVVVVLDTGDLGRLGSLYVPQTFACCPLINIDHHVSNTRFGTVNVIDTQAAAVGEMILDLLQMMHVALHTAAATCLLTAIVTDTLGFRTTSTTAHTLNAAATLMAAGAPLNNIVEQSFDSRPLPVLRIWGRVLSTFTVRDGIAWAAVPQRLLIQHGVKEDDVKGLANVMRGTQGVVVSVLLLETPEGKVKTEFRSNGKVNVAEIARALGGGGHRAASGCLLPGPLAAAERRVLGEVRKYM